jgi:hypothetical protein
MFSSHGFNSLVSFFSPIKIFGISAYNYIKCDKGLHNSSFVRKTLILKILKSTTKIRQKKGRDGGSGNLLNINNESQTHHDHHSHTSLERQGKF